MKKFLRNSTKIVALFALIAFLAFQCVNLYCCTAADVDERLYRAVEKVQYKTNIWLTIVLDGWDYIVTIPLCRVIAENHPEGLAGDSQESYLEALESWNNLLEKRFSIFSRLDQLW